MSSGKYFIHNIQFKETYIKTLTFWTQIISISYHLCCIYLLEWDKIKSVKKISRSYLTSEIYDCLIFFNLNLFICVETVFQI